MRHRWSLIVALVVAGAFAVRGSLQAWATGGRTGTLTLRLASDGASLKSRPSGNDLASGRFVGVHLDRKPLGVAPLSAPVSLLAGAHRVTVALPNWNRPLYFDARTSELHVEPDADVEVTLDASHRDRGVLPAYAASSRWVDIESLTVRQLEERMESLNPLEYAAAIEGLQRDAAYKQLLTAANDVATTVTLRGIEAFDRESGSTVTIDIELSPVELKWLGRAIAYNYLDRFDSDHAHFEDLSIAEKRAQALGNERVASHARWLRSKMSQGDEAVVKARADLRKLMDKLVDAAKTD
jgi:hypothetical protein